MFSVPKHTFEGFFKKTFQNFLVFWHKLKRDDYLKLIDKLNWKMISKFLNSDLNYKLT